MTKRERARDAARWRCIARRIEGDPDGAHFLCCEAGDEWGILRLFVSERLTEQPPAVAALDLFRPDGGRQAWWHYDESDCRVIAAGLLAAMTEAGDLG